MVIEFIKEFTGLIAALGGVIFLALVFNIINYIVNRKRLNEQRKMNKTLNEIKELLKKKN